MCTINNAKYNTPTEFSNRIPIRLTPPHLSNAKPRCIYKVDGKRQKIRRQGPETKNKVHWYSLNTTIENEPSLLLIQWVALYCKNKYFLNLRRGLSLFLMNIFIINLCWLVDIFVMLCPLKILLVVFVLWYVFLEGVG